GNVGASLIENFGHTKDMLVGYAIGEAAEEVGIDPVGQAALTIGLDAIFNEGAHVLPAIDGSIAGLAAQGLQNLADDKPFVADFDDYVAFSVNSHYAGVIREGVEDAFRRWNNPKVDITGMPEATPLTEQMAEYNAFQSEAISTEEFMEWLKEASKDPEMQKTLASIGIGFIPVAETAQDLHILLTGKNAMWQDDSRMIALLGAAIPLIASGHIKILGKGGNAIV
ncbi:MAG: hypothetical protein GY766_05510, partial [Herbaspirillum sp.]|uniref:hypothetical protein n=1 Tax=Herbaspirillum sp. TaxID=1890675 RepID=UPI0025862F79